MTDTDTDTLQEDFTEKNAALTRKPKYATFNMRMFAAIIDVTIVLMVAFPLGGFIDRFIFPPMDPGAFDLLGNPALTQQERIDLLWQIMSEQKVFSRMIFTNFFQCALFASYIIPCWIRYNNTLGKMLVGIEIRDAATLNLMTRSQMIRRFIGYMISGAALTIGFAWMIFSKKKQCWHDSIAGTIVVIKDKKPFSLALRSASQ